MGYLYETHLHTCLSSACGVSTGKEHVHRYRDMGYAGIIVTDHFFGGNTAAPRTGKWEDRIDAFLEGYEDARAEGEKCGLPVMFGWEQGYGDDEYLIYGLDGDWLKAHPEIETASRARQLELVHAGGGCVIQAHPFRMRTRYMHYIRLGPRFCDGVEVMNAGNLPINDIYAWNFAHEYHLLMTAGSDNHNSYPKSGDPELFGVIWEEPLRDIHDYVSRILAGQQPGLWFPESRLSTDISGEAPLVSYMLSETEELVPTGRTWENAYAGADAIL